MKIHLAAFTAATLNLSTLLNAAPSAHPSTSTAAAETATEAAALESAGRAAKAAEDWELKGESSFTADQSQRRARAVVADEDVVPGVRRHRLLGHDLQRVVGPAVDQVADDSAAFLEQDVSTVLVSSRVEGLTVTPYDPAPVLGGLRPLDLTVTG